MKVSKNVRQRFFFTVIFKLFNFHIILLQATSNTKMVYQ